MPAVSAQLSATTPFTIDAGTGKLYIDFEDGTQLEFSSVGDLVSWMQDNTPKQSHAQAIAVARALREDVLLDDKAKWAGRKVVIDVEAATPAGIIKETKA